MDVLVSIIVPVYKVPEDLLRRCIESCLNQTETSIEVILVDDCSPDGCGNICDEYARLDSRVKVIHKKQNGGLSAARNSGFHEASGEWITFVDGDDWIESGTCGLIHYGESDDKLELIFFGTFRDYNNSCETMKFQYEDMKKYSKEECSQLQLDILNYYKRLSTAYAKFIRRSFLLKNNLEHNETLRMGIEGIDFNVRMFGELSCAMSIDRPMYHYVYNDESYTAKPNENRIKMLLLGLHAIDEYISSRKNNNRLAERFDDRIFRAVSDTAIGIYFNPDYKISYLERKKGLERFLNDELIRETLNRNSASHLTKLQTIVIRCAKNKWYMLLRILGAARKYRMKSK